MSSASLVVVVMGVSGAGKSTVGRRLADRLGAEFVEGDDFHPGENVARMAAGLPLNEVHREPWLDALATRVTDAVGDGSPTVVAASALRRAHRDLLRGAGPVTFLFLFAAPDELAHRVESREHDFMPAELLDDQLATLEPPGPDERDVVIVRSAGSIEATVEDALEALVRSSSSAGSHPDENRQTNDPGRDTP